MPFPSALFKRLQKLPESLMSDECGRKCIKVSTPWSYLNEILQSLEVRLGSLVCSIMHKDQHVLEEWIAVSLLIRLQCFGCRCPTPQTEKHTLLFRPCLIVVLIDCLHTIICSSVCRLIRTAASAMHHKLGFTGTYGLVKSEEDRSLKAPSCNSQDSNNPMPGSRDTPTGLVAVLRRVRAALPTNY